jgi:hypothetical protein
MISPFEQPWMHRLIIHVTGIAAKFAHSLSPIVDIVSVAATPLKVQAVRATRHVLVRSRHSSDGRPRWAILSRRSYFFRFRFCHR